MWERSRAASFIPPPPPDLLAFTPTVITTTTTTSSADLPLPPPRPAPPHRTPPPGVKGSPVPRHLRPDLLPGRLIYVHLCEDKGSTQSPGETRAPSWLCKPGEAGLDLHAAEHSGTPNAKQTLPMDGGGLEREAGGLRWIWRSGRGGRLILKEQGHKRPENRSQAQAESHPSRELSYGPWVSDSALWLNRRSPADETLRAKRAAAPSEEKTTCLHVHTHVHSSWPRASPHGDGPCPTQCTTGPNPSSPLHPWPSGSIPFPFVWCGGRYGVSGAGVWCQRG
ncbi:unnamed protein product [Gadus morhua 'NCC']